MLARLVASGALLGLSGGIDSALTLAVAVDVLVRQVGAEGFALLDQNGQAIRIPGTAQVVEITRQGDVVARLGGDEFLVLLTDITAPARSPSRWWCS